MNIFQKIKLNKYNSIYEKINYLININQLNDFNNNIELYELQYLKNKEKSKNINFNQIIQAINLYKEKDLRSIKLIDEYFKKNKAIYLIDELLNYFSSLEEFDESLLIGLSILLIRDSNIKESVKFGIILSEYYQLIELNYIIDIIKKLSFYPEFTLYGLRSFTSFNNYDHLKEEIYKNTNKNGKEIIKLYDKFRISKI